VVTSTAKAKTAYARSVISNNMNKSRKLWKTHKRMAPAKSAPSNFSFIEEEAESI